MAKKRSYRLLCPIARALDKVGDRWTLLILRDLHAGPARFSELQEGLSGLASNLLSSRLQLLQDDGLVHRGAGPHGAQLYELTGDGEATAPLLFELSRYGTRFSLGDDIRRPGNLRTVAVNMKESLRRVAGPTSNAHVELLVDDEAFSIRITNGDVTVRYGADPSAPVCIATSYEPIVATADGRMSAESFGRDHVRPTRGTEREVGAFLGLMARAFAA